MITKMNNPRLSYFSRIITLPIIALVVLAFSSKSEMTKNEMVIDVNAENNKSDTIPALYYKGKKVKGVSVVPSREHAYLTYEDGKKDSLPIKEAKKLNLLPPPPPNVITVQGHKTPAPLYIVDGKEFTGNINDLNPQSIQSIDVYKGATAMEKHGEKGKNGVVVITLKSQVVDKIVNDVLKDDRFRDSVKIKEGFVDGQPVINKSDGLKEVVVLGKPLDANKQTSEPTFEKAEIEASVNLAEWRKFLADNLQSVIKELANSGAKGKYTLMLRFIVEKNGNITDLKCLNDPGFDLCEKVKKIMVNSPKWKPAEQNRKIVRSYHTQPITVIITDQ